MVKMHSTTSAICDNHLNVLKRKYSDKTQVSIFSHLYVLSSTLLEQCSI